jgi:membrane protein DedA with SNARE-associated domain
MLTLTACLAIMGATLVAEDATAIGVGLSVRDGSLPLVPALLACMSGILAGDIGLWAAGRFAGRRAAARFAARVAPERLASLGAWVDRHPAAAIFASRFTPGLRLPLYVAAGVWGGRPWRFLLWMTVAVVAWTPLLVLGVAWAGRAVAGPLEAWLGGGWLSRGGTVLVAAAALHVVLGLASREGRARASLRWARLRRWEFWPAWIVNAPIAIWILLVGLRHRSVTVFTAANPAIAHGGVIGESKADILSRLPQAWVLPWRVIEPGPAEARLAQFRGAVEALGGRFPVVLKPDVGERGAGVRWVRSEADAAAYLAGEPRRVLLQVAHAGPFEAGVFYVRHPGEPRGRIFSLTDKRFPWIVGDGRSTLAALVLAHPRFRLQAHVFLARHAAQRDRVPAAGERVRLAEAGNHAQGTEFRDGRALVTPALEARVDAIARQIDGFYFGRFDVRYRDRDAFMAGDDFSIVELNGVTSEATHIYDPAGSIWQAWRTLAEQWSIAFAIGAANRARGHRVTPPFALVRLVWTGLRARPALTLAD